MEHISKSRFKPHALEIMRAVERSGKSIIITDHGNPVLELRPFRPEQAKEDPLEYLKGSVLEYIDPTEPVAEDDWEQQ